MFWLFAICLLALVLLFAFKSYEQQFGRFVVFAQSRRRFDKRLIATGRYLQRQLWRIISAIRSAIYQIAVRARHSFAEWLRSLAARIDLR